LIAYANANRLPQELTSYPLFGQYIVFVNGFVLLAEECNVMFEIFQSLAVLIVLPPPSLQR